MIKQAELKCAIMTKSTRLRAEVRARRDNDIRPVQSGINLRDEASSSTLLIALADLDPSASSSLIACGSCRRAECSRWRSSAMTTIPISEASNNALVTEEHTYLRTHRLRGPGLRFRLFAEDA